MPTTGVIPGSGFSKDSPRRPPSRRSTSARTSTPEIPRPDSSTSVRSGGSTSWMYRTMSHGSTSSMKRTLSRDSTSGKKGSKQFVVKSKVSRSHRSSSSGHLPRTPSFGKGSHQLTSLTMTQAVSAKRDMESGVAPKQQVTQLPYSALNLGKRKSSSMSAQDEVAARQLMRLALNDEEGNNLPCSSNKRAPIAAIERIKQSFNCE
jgi:hypothetical protein